MSTYNWDEKFAVLMLSLLYVVVMPWIGQSVFVIVSHSTPPLCCVTQNWFETLNCHACFAVDEVLEVWKDSCDRHTVWAATAVPPMEAVQESICCLPGKSMGFSPNWACNSCQVCSCTFISILVRLGFTTGAEWIAKLNRSLRVDTGTSQRRLNVYCGSFALITT